MLSSLTAHYENTVPPRWRKFAPAIALALAVFIFYGNVYGNEFLFDDELLIQRNTLLQGWDTFWRLFTASTTEGAYIAGGFFRPVQMILYFFVYQVAGLSTFAFHFLNVALHAADACLLFGLGRKLGFDARAAFLAVLLWALHPVHTEAVTYMSATADGLFVFFCLIGLLMLPLVPTARKMLAVIPVFLLALFSKETAVVFPLLAMAVIWFRNPGRVDYKNYLPVWPLLLIAACFIAWRLMSPAYDGPASYAHIYQAREYHNLQLYADQFGMRFYTFLATLPAYLGLLLWPAGLHMERSFPVSDSFWLLPVMAGAAMLIAAVIFIARADDKTWRPAKWGLLWFAASHAPDTGLLIAVNAIFLEHWMYLPSAGLFLGVGQSLYLFTERNSLKPARTYLVAAALAVSLVFGGLTFMQNRTWRDPIVFYNHLFSFGTETARAHNNLGLAYGARGDYQHAVVEFNRAIAIGDTYAETRHNLGLALLSMPGAENNVEEAKANFLRALEINPNFYRACIALSQLYEHEGDKEKAESYRKRAEDILARDKFNP